MSSNQQQVRFILTTTTFCKLVAQGTNGYAGYSKCQDGALICQNNGVCINNTNCQCYPGFTGNDCSYDITCDPISSLLRNAQLISDQGNAYSAMVTYTCRYGFQMRDASDSGQMLIKTVFCNEDSTWGPSFASCVPECPVIPIWNGYKVEGGSSLSQARLYGGQLQYSCSGNYDQASAAAFVTSEGSARYQFADGDTGVKTSYCIDGLWTPPIVPCTDYLYYVDPSSSAPAAVRIRLIDMSLLVSLIVVIFR